MFKYILTLLLAFSVSQSNAQFFDGDSTEFISDDTSVDEETPRVRKYPARLWEITGNGLKQPSYLYGTMHVSKKLAFNLGDTFYKALQSVDVIALELAIDSWLSNIGRNSENYYFGFNKFGQYGYQYGNFYKSALSFEETKLAGLLAELRSEDYMSNFLLYRQGYQSPDFSEKTYVDLYIHQVGKKLNKFCTGLEDFEISRRMVNRSEWRDRKFPRERDYSSSYYYDYDEDPTEKAYREGDLDMIDSLEKRDNPDKHFLKWMLYERNKVMADQIEQIVKTKKLFAAVGCAHLPGDSGVIEFLRRKGFTLTPVYDNAGDYAFKQKQKLEATTSPVTFRKYVSHNGELSFELPGTPLDRSFSNTEDIFFADVANGAYYVLKKLPFYGGVNGVSQQKLLKQLDSALYENIPGDITSRSKTTVNGFPALDVSNRTKSGESQRHMYIIMPNHVWYIKLSATGNYAEGREARDFFKSISLQANPVKWNSYSPDCGGYEVNWPTTVTRNRLSFDTSTNYKGHTSLEYTDDKGNFYFLRSLNLPYYGFDEDTFHMHQIAVNYAFYNGGKMEDVEFRTINGHKAMQSSIRLKDKGIYLHFLIAADGDKFYNLGVFTDNRRPPADFLSSFRFTPFKYKYLPVKDHDPLADISYKRPDWTSIKEIDKIKKEESEIAHREIIYPEASGYSYSSVGEYFKDTLLADTRYVFPVNFPSGEDVSINVYSPDKIAPESYFNELRKRGVLIGDSLSMTRARFIEDSLDHYWDSVYHKNNKTTYKNETEPEKILDTGYLQNGFVISESITGQPGTSWLDYSKNVLGENVMYSVSTRYDRTRGMSDVVRDVIASIEYTQPKHTTIDSTAFGKLMIRLLSSSDSIDLFRAYDYSHFMSVIPKSFNDTLMKLLVKFDKNSLYGKLYTEPIESKLIADDHLPLIGYYMDKYRRGGDTSEIQARMLANLGRMHNTEALDSLMYWLLEETPLAPENSYNSYLYSGIIYTAYDTLELWKDRFKKLLPLNRYEEYEDAIMSLGITLLDSQMIDSTVFVPMIPELTLSFRDDLKRKISKSEGRSGYGYNYNSYSGNYATPGDPDNYEYGTYGNTLFGDGAYGAEYGMDYTVPDVGSDGYSIQFNRMHSVLGPDNYAPGLSPFDWGNPNGNSGGNTLLDKARILARFYYQDPDVAKRMKRVYVMQDKIEKMQFLNLYLKHRISMPDTMYRHYLSEKDCQYGFIQMLKKYKLTDSIPATFYDEKTLVNSFAYYHHYTKKDTVVFLGKKQAPIEDEKGTMYFYKHRNKEEKREKKDEGWQYSYIWIGDKDTLNTMVMPRYYRLNVNMNKKQSVKDMMEMEVSKLVYWKHPMWQALQPVDESEQGYGSGDGWGWGD